MPVVVKLSIMSLDAVRGALHYFGDKLHPNHTAHEIREVEVRGGTGVDHFMGRLAGALSFLNRVADPRHQLTKVGTWWVCSFRSGTSLSLSEQADYSERMVHVLGCENFHVQAWHLGLNGSADLNILDPGIKFGALPEANRPRNLNLLARARYRSDAWTAAANWTRSEAGLPQIALVAEGQAARRSSAGEEMLEDSLVSAASRAGLEKITIEALPSVMNAAGYGAADWEVDLRENLVLRRLPGRVRKKAKKDSAWSVPLPTIFAHLNLHLLNDSIVREQFRRDARHAPARDRHTTPEEGVLRH